MRPLSSIHRLATYGTLAPGEVNEKELSSLKGVWFTGTVKGRLIDAGWGADHGCPGMKVDEGGDDIAVHLFESIDLPDHWKRLDAFEGAEYRRVEVSVKTQNGTVLAFIYELAL